MDLTVGQLARISWPALLAAVIWALLGTYSLLAGEATTSFFSLSMAGLAVQLAAIILPVFAVYHAIIAIIVLATGLLDQLHAGWRIALVAAVSALTMTLAQQTLFSWLGVDPVYQTERQLGYFLHAAAAVL